MVRNKGSTLIEFIEQKMITDSAKLTDKECQQREFYVKIINKRKDTHTGFINAGCLQARLGSDEHFGIFDVQVQECILK